MAVVELHRQQHRLDGCSLTGTVMTDTPSGGGEGEAVVYVLAGKQVGDHGAIRAARLSRLLQAPAVGVEPTPDGF